ncbi:MAG: zinc ABC transporter substrate-binding protein [Gammaproteobacteria bacterium]|nr:zinc ABC transporter substrate-binding protein [Gammaproteobacteria bacterium]
MYKYKLCLMLFFLTTGYSNEAPNHISILTSIRPVHSLVNAVIGESSTPGLLLSAQQSPHHLTLKPSQIKQIQDADIIFMIDPSFETFMTKPLQSKNPKTKVIYLEEAPGISKLSYRQSQAWHSHEDHHHDGPVDGHIWLDPDNAKAMVQTIANILSNANPNKRHLYQQNAKNYIKKINDLNTEIQLQLFPVKHVPFLVFHDGYQYFEHSFGLNGQGSIVFEPNDSLKASRLQAIDRQIKTHQIHCVFQDTPGNPRIIQMIELNFKINTQVLDPLGINLSPGPNLYLNLLKNMSNDMLKCLSTS